MAKAYGVKSCSARASQNRVILNLAQPLSLTPAYDARDELLSRHVISVIHGQGHIPYDMVVDGSFPAIQVGYGWPTAWSMQTGGALDPRLPSIAHARLRLHADGARNRGSVVGHC